MTTMLKLVHFWPKGGTRHPPEKTIGDLLREAAQAIAIGADPSKIQNDWPDNLNSQEKFFGP
jgi:hypothetical protein